MVTLTESTLPVDQLLLDPDNPRFIADLTARPPTPADDIEKRQPQVLDRFRRTVDSGDSDLDVTNIRDLYASMLRIGFVGIDRIVVRKINHKFLVVEGNRRVATVKHLRRDYDSRTPPLDRPAQRAEFDAHSDSFDSLPVVILETGGLSQHDLDSRIATILGIRHHGSVLEWDPLPKAYNIYTEYLEESPDHTDFRFHNTLAKKVADRLCIQSADVKSALRTYVALLQVRERFSDVKDHHFSLIDAILRNRHLTAASYIKSDSDTFQLEESSLSKLNRVCQFSTRDSSDPERTVNGKKKILKVPQACSTLGRLLRRTRHANHTAVTEFGESLIRRVEDEDDHDMTVDHALDELTFFENRTKWVAAVDGLLNKQDAELRIDSYMGEGLDRGRKDGLLKTLEPLKKILNI